MYGLRSCKPAQGKGGLKQPGERSGVVVAAFRPEVLNLQRVCLLPNGV
jgi:hypothetical protein